MHHVSAATSERMARVRRAHTAPEIAVRKAAHRAGLRFRLQVRDLPGRPDLVFPRWRVALFVHGCFWHQHENCARATVPVTRSDYWRAKFARNAKRDATVAADSELAGWKVLVVWECASRDEENLERLFQSRPFRIAAGKGFSRRERS